jgi:hypothetical protein
VEIQNIRNTPPDEREVCEHSPERMLDKKTFSEELSRIMLISFWENGRPDFKGNILWFRNLLLISLIVNLLLHSNHPPSPTELQ